jgi:Rps23 Pro-64 3,4-dihydroxylase Tpa1-like proline 4-hydroxylase
MVSYNNFLTKDECEYIINYTQSSHSITNIIFSRNFEFYHINDYTNFSFLNEKFKNINIINDPVFNINKYNKGCFFAPHVDAGGKNDINKERIKTIIINISNPNTYEGGELFINNNLIEQSQGSLFMFN